jgi:hypothetical protein
VILPNFPAKTPFFKVFDTLITYSLSSGPISIGGASSTFGTTLIFLARSVKTIVFASCSRILNTLTLIAYVIFVISGARSSDGEMVESPMLGGRRKCASCT